MIRPKATTLALALLTALAGCESEGTTAEDTAADVVLDVPADPGAGDATLDPGPADPGLTDPGATDPGAADPGPADPGTTDPGPGDAGGADMAGGGCTSDDDCTHGEAWCQNGECVPCDNSAMVCDIACPQGYDLTERNGCTPCQCVLVNACTSDAECDAGVCVAGPICLPWCDWKDPTCCYGNTCEASALACDTPNPQACTDTGCPPGMRCEPTAGAVCMASHCWCSTAGGVGDWACTDDCVSGVCAAAP